MDTNRKLERPRFLRIPCGKVLGHGEYCCEGHLCDQCDYILELEALVVKYENEKNLNCLTEEK